MTDSMWLVLGFHTWYVADSLYNEVCTPSNCSLNKSMTLVNKPSLFTTMDIVSDGFGFMLSVGDLVVVPFTYSLQARYLAFHPVELGPIWTLAILGTNLLGYYIFRTANAEKDDFRNGKNPKSGLFSHFFPSIPDGEYRVNIYVYQTRNKVAYVGMVGTLTPPELLVRQRSTIYRFLRLTFLLTVETGSWVSHGVFLPLLIHPSPISMHYTLPFSSSIDRDVMTRPA